MLLLGDRGRNNLWFSFLVLKKEEKERGREREMDRGREGKGKRMECLLRRLSPSNPCSQLLPLTELSKLECNISPV